MKQMLLLEKRVGETPLACVDRFRSMHPDYRSVKMTYAGRLDPIASGLLMVLVGDAVHEKDSYLGLSKTYECSCVLGIATDTYDVLGIPTKNFESTTLLSESKLLNQLFSYLGTFEQDYPPFSSKTIDGIQMHAHARAGTLEYEKVPKQGVTVLAIESVTITQKKVSELLSTIHHIIDTVKGDFRQYVIKHAWDERGVLASDNNGTVVSFTITVSGGTYIRGIVNDLGKKLGIGACVLSLHRTKIGDFNLKNKDF